MRDSKRVRHTEGRGSSLLRNAGKFLPDTTTLRSRRHHSHIVNNFIRPLLTQYQVSTSRIHRLSEDYLTDLRNSKTNTLSLPAN